MTTTIVGIDPSLRRTGLARITLADFLEHGPSSRDLIVESWARPSTGRRRDDIGQRWTRLFGITADVLAYALPCTLVVIEGPSLGSRGVGSSWDRSGLWWRIVGRLLDGEIPVAVVPPRCRAKWATGSGGADKNAVREAVTQLWQPHWQPTYPGDDNEADALVLASMGAQWLGRLPVTGPDPAALSGVDWPDRDEVDA